MLIRYVGFNRALNMLMCAMDLQEMNIKLHISSNYLSKQLLFYGITSCIELWSLDRTNALW